MKKTWGIVIIIIGLLIIFIMASIGFGVYLFLNVPSMSDQVSPESKTVRTYIESPSGGTTWPMNSYIPFTITAQSSQPIVKIELYINGTLYETRDLAAAMISTSYMEPWTWQPGTTGEFHLIARGIDSTGNTGVSIPLILHATEEASTISPVVSLAGDTLESIAASANTTVDVILSDNPKIDPTAPLGADTTVNIPNPPSPVTNTNIIKGFPEVKVDPIITEPETGKPQFSIGTDWLPQQNAQGDEQAPVELVDIGFEKSLEIEANPTPGISQLDEFEFWIKNVFKVEPSNPPLEPETEASFSGCNVKVRLMNIGIFFDASPGFQNANEDGFFIYRSRDGEPYERIATLPKILDYATTKEGLYQITDNNQFGVVSYYISSFNSMSEISGKPVTIPLSEAGCVDPDPNSNKVYLDHGDLILPNSMDLAYFYLQVENTESGTSRGFRIPEGTRFFQPESGHKLNLVNYLSDYLDIVQDTDLDALLDVWAWSGGKLNHLGNYSIKIHRTVLMICSVEGEGGCTGGGGGQWQTELALSDTKPVADQVYEIRWATSTISKIDNFCEFFSSSINLNTGIFNPDTLIYANCRGEEKNSGIGKIYMSWLFPETEASSYLGKWDYLLTEYRSNWFHHDYGNGKQFSVFYSITPKLEQSGFNSKSNTIILNYKTSTKPVSDMPPLASEFPSIYELDILEDEYIPPDFLVKSKYGCVIIDKDPTGKYAIGQEVCPPKLYEKVTNVCDDQWTFGCLWALVKEGASAWYQGLEFVAQGIVMYKQFLAGGLADIIPGCEDEEWCKDAIKEGINYGVTYLTGLPPHFSSFGDIAKGYISSGIASEFSDGVEAFKEACDTGCSEVGDLVNFVCDEDCKKKLGDKIAAELISAKSKASQPACYGYSYEYGVKQNCLDPSIEVHPASNSNNYPGVAVVRVTRKSDPETAAIPKTGKENFQVEVMVWTKNSFMNKDIEGPAYSTSRASIPWLNPGESIDVAVVLLPCAYGMGVSGCDTSNNFGGFQNLYFNGAAHMTATEICYSSNSTTDWVPCINGGKDTWDFTNPSKPEGISE